MTEENNTLQPQASHTFVSCAHKSWMNVWQGRSIAQSRFDFDFGRANMPPDQLALQPLTVHTLFWFWCFSNIDFLSLLSHFFIDINLRTPSILSYFHQLRLRPAPFINKNVKAFNSCNAQDIQNHTAMLQNFRHIFINFINFCLQKPCFCQDLLNSAKLVIRVCKSRTCVWNEHDSRIKKKRLCRLEGS